MKKTCYKWLSLNTLNLKVKMLDPKQSWIPGTPVKSLVSIRLKSLLVLMKLLLILVFLWKKNFLCLSPPSLERLLFMPGIVYLYIIHVVSSKQRINSKHLQNINHILSYSSDLSHYPLRNLNFVDYRFFSNKCLSSTPPLFFNFWFKLKKKVRQFFPL